MRTIMRINHRSQYRQQGLLWRMNVELWWYRSTMGTVSECLSSVYSLVHSPAARQPSLFTVSSQTVYLCWRKLRMESRRRRAAIRSIHTQMDGHRGLQVRRISSSSSRQVMFTWGPPTGITDRQGLRASPAGQQGRRAPSRGLLLQLRRWNDERASVPVSGDAAGRPALQGAAAAESGQPPRSDGRTAPRCRDAG